MRRRNSEPGSMDMLLDTMCNTFGGVCFIALMVSIISAVLPRTPDEEVEHRVSESDLVSREMAKLTLRRDQLRTAVRQQEEFVARNATNWVTQADIDRLV